jgi:hypothetical protein
VGAQHVAVADRVRDDEEQEINAAVTELEGESPRKRLEVKQADLRLAAGSPATDPDHGIPRPSVPGDRHWYLGLPSGPRWEPIAKPGEQRQLPRIAQWVAIRIGLERDPQADDRCHSTRLINPEVRDDPSLDPAPVRVRHARGGGCGPLAQSCTKSGDPQVLTEGATDPSSLVSGFDACTPSLDHPATLASTAHLALISADRRHRIATERNPIGPASNRARRLTFQTP